MEMQLVVDKNISLSQLKKRIRDLIIKHNERNVDKFEIDLRDYEVMLNNNPLNAEEFGKIKGKKSNKTHLISLNYKKELRELRN